MKLLFMATTKSHTVFSHYRSIFTVNLGIMDLPSGIQQARGRKPAVPTAKQLKRGTSGGQREKKMLNQPKVPNVGHQNVYSI